MFILDEINSEQFEMILSNVCLLITTGTREVVGSALSFIKVIITSFFNDLMPHLSTIVCIIIILYIFIYVHVSNKNFLIFNM